MKKIKLCLLLISMIAFFISCDKNKEKTLKNTNARLVYAMGNEPVTLDPYSATDIFSRRIIINIFDTLIETNSENNKIPSLAKSWKYLNDKTLEIKLKENVEFHNGDILTSKDVKYSLETGKKSIKVGYYFDMIKEIRTPDLNTVIIETYEPSGTLLVTLSHPVSSIVNKKYYEKNKNNETQPIGTGAYRLNEWRSGYRLILSKFDKYFGLLPTINLIEIKIIPEENSRAIALETGETHVSYELSVVDMILLKSKKDINTFPTESPGVVYLGFNNSNSKLSDIRIRKAIAMGLDIDGAIDALFTGQGKKSKSILGPKVFGYSEFEYPKYDLTEAKKLLEEVNGKNLELKLTISNSNLNKQLGEIFQGQLKELGINLKLEILDFGVFLKEINNKNESEIFIHGWSNSTGDADNGFTTLFHSKNIGANNRFFYSNNEFDKIIDTARNEMNQIKRVEYYEKAQKILVTDLPFLPIHSIFYNSGVHSNIDGFEPDSQAYLKFNKLKFK